MAPIVGYVKKIEGIYFAKDIKGHIRALKIGDTVYEKETVYANETSAGQNKIEIALWDGAKTLVLAGNDPLDLDTALLRSVLLSNDSRINVDDVKLYISNNLSTDYFNNDNVTSNQNHFNSTTQSNHNTAPASNGSVVTPETNISFNNTLISDPVAQRDAPVRDVRTEVELDLLTQPNSGQNQIIEVVSSINTKSDVTNIDSVTVAEGSAAVFTVSLSNNATIPVTYSLSLLDGSATIAGSDYTNAMVFSNSVTYDSATGLITVPANTTSFTVTVPTVDNNVAEPTENFTLIVGGIIGSGIITDNDPFVDVNENVSVVEDTVLNGSVLTGTSSFVGPVSVTQFIISGTIYPAGATATIAGEGTLTIASNGDYIFTPVSNWNGTVTTVTYTMTDGVYNNTSILNITVTPVNDAPIPNDPTNPTFDPTTGNYSVSTPEDTAVSGQVVGS
ncbi:MAG: cadherin-like domain-containing protein, partial [Sulfuricurvum sp.]|nr:cadherin-like domain-containing protein [Sulfuricurvum sp.]